MSEVVKKTEKSLSYAEIVERVKAYRESSEFDSNIKRSMQVSIRIRQESYIEEEVLSQPIII